MKRLSFKIDRFQAAKLSLPVRSKRDVVLIWMNAIKIMSSYVPFEDEHAVGTLHLLVSSMSRIFVSTETRLISLNFPFAVKAADQPYFYNHACGDIDSRISSEIISLIENSRVLEKSDIYSFADILIASSEIHSDAWSLLRDVLSAEDGYVRFDHDPDRENGKLHPINHVDIFYSNSATLKIGTPDRMTIIELADLLDISTDCRFAVQLP